MRSKSLLFISILVWLISFSLLMMGCAAETSVMATPTEPSIPKTTQTIPPPTATVPPPTAVPTESPSPSPTVEEKIFLSQLPVISAGEAKRIREITRWHERSAVNSVAFSPQGDLIAWGNQEGQIVMVRLGEDLSAADQQRLQWVAHTQRINSLRFSPSGSLLASGSEDYTAKLWDPLAGTLIKEFKGYEDGIAALAFSADEKWLAVSSYDFKVHLWKAKEAGAARDFSTKNTFAQGLAFSPDGKLLAVAANEWKARLFSVQLWQVINGKLIHTIRGFQERLNGMAFSPQGDWLAVGSGDDITPQQDQVVYLINVSAAKVAQLFKGHTGAVLQVAFSAQQPLLASASSDGTVRVWSVPQGDLLSVLEHNSSVTDVAFSADGKLLLSAAKDGVVRLWGITP